MEADNNSFDRLKETFEPKNTMTTGAWEASSKTLNEVNPANLCVHFVIAMYNGMGFINNLTLDLKTDPDNAIMEIITARHVIANGYDKEVKTEGQFEVDLKNNPQELINKLNEKLTVEYWASGSIGVENKKAGLVNGDNITMKEAKAYGIIIPPKYNDICMVKCKVPLNQIPCIKTLRSIVNTRKKFDELMNNLAPWKTFENNLQTLFGGYKSDVWQFGYNDSMSPKLSATKKKKLTMKADKITEVDVIDADSGVPVLLIGDTATANFSGVPGDSGGPLVMSKVIDGKSFNFLLAAYSGAGYCPKDFSEKKGYVDTYNDDREHGQANLFLNNAAVCIKQLDIAITNNDVTVIYQV